MSIIYQRWRCGSQVGRTLYVDHGADRKDPSYLFGLVDDAEIAAHIVEIHNRWLEVVEATEVEPPSIHTAYGDSRLQ